MNVTLKNIGTLKEATFDLDKDLTVFIGPNNTGKTYAAYCLYGLCKRYVQFGEILMDIFPAQVFEPLVNERNVELDLVELFTLKNVKALYEVIEKNFISQLPQLFALDRSAFDNSSIKFGLTTEQELVQHLKESIFHLSATSSRGLRLAYKKLEGTARIRISIEVGEGSSIDEDYLGYIRQNITYHLFHPLFQNWGVYFFPAERIGISVFSKDLFANRFTRTNELLSLDIPNRNKVFEMMSREFNVYSLVVQDAINDYEKILRSKYKEPARQEFAKLSNELEEKLLKGKLNVDADGNVLFETESKAIVKIQAAGTIIKSLAALSFYLKYTATRDQLLIIDEPEINLHPDNQRFVARILAKLSKLGVKVIVSTHSDYFIRELNNLIMLNKQHPETLALREKYRYDETEVLDHTKVGAYLFKDNKATAMEVTESGMEAATIDEEINKLNNTANDIYWTLFED